eukprot:49437-Alexandrium_andersonii.AAC.1
MPPTAAGGGSPAVRTAHLWAAEDAPGCGLAPSRTGCSPRSGAGCRTGPARPSRRTALRAAAARLRRRP